MKRNLFFALLFGSAAAFAEPVRLAENGVASAEIVLEKNAPKTVRFAAMELKHHLDALTGGDFRIREGEGTGAGTVIRLGGKSEDFENQQYQIAFRPGEILLAGKDSPDGGSFRLSYDGNNSAYGSGWPDLYDQNGTLYAVYDFLRDFCGVKWLNPTDAGSVIPSNPNLTVSGETLIRKPGIAYRGGTFDWKLASELWKEKTPGWEAYMKTAYPAAYASGNPESRIDQQKKIYLLRMKAGGDFMPANHSFYNYYERFLIKNHKNFESFHPEYFAKGLDAAHAAAGFIDSGYDGSREPPQLCYSNPATIEQVVKDVRNYFDNGGYSKLYRNIGRTGYIWGRDAFCLEPMDNDGFCRCPECLKQYEPARKNGSSEHSTYWFRFVNTVAKEIAKTHPGKKITTLAYMTREGLPSGIRLEKNVVVYFCMSCNRMPYCGELAAQISRLEEWHRAYPENAFGLWLYNTFPQERTYIRGQEFNCFPGFFGKTAAEQYRLFEKCGVKYIFHCGFVDDFENYVSLRCMFDPETDYGKLKEEYFSAFGGAEKDIRSFYDLVEKVYCDPANYPSGAMHQNKSIAWGKLGVESVMKKLSGFMESAEKTADTPKAKNLVAAWKAGYWDYMCAGNREELPSETRGGITLARTKYYGRTPDPFGKSVLSGKSVSIEFPKECCFLLNGGMASPSGIATFTDGLFKGNNFLNGGGKDAKAVYKCETPVSGLKKLRITVKVSDSARGRFVLTPVGLVNGGWKDLDIAAENNLWENWTAEPTPAYLTLEYTFAPGSIPEKLDGIGFRDESLSKGYYWPRYAQIEAE